MTTCVRWGRGDGVLVGIKTPRPHVPVQQVRRPVGLAPRPRDEADGVVLAPAAPLLAEAALGDAGHFFRGVRAGSPRSSRRCWWCAPRRAGWVLARERCGRCNCACCCFAVTHGPGGSARKIELAQYWAQRWLLLCLARTSTGRRGRFFLSASVDQPARYVLGSPCDVTSLSLDIFRLLCLELGADFGESVTARPHTPSPRV